MQGGTKKSRQLRLTKQERETKETEWIVTHSAMGWTSTRGKIPLYMRSGFFWVFAQCVGVIPYRPLGTSYRSHLEGPFLTSEDGIDKMSRDVGKELSLHTAEQPGIAQIYVHCGGNVKSLLSNISTGLKMRRTFVARLWV
jgi:hypothetical protein